MKLLFIILTLYNVKAYCSHHFFLTTKISTLKPYMQEGVKVDYFIYSRNKYENVEVLSWPIFKNCLKRYIPTYSYWENVQYKGKRYWRMHKYSTIIYPLKSGPLKIGKLTVKIGNDYIMGKEKQIVVLNWPIKGLDSRFTGLVGLHKFSFSKIKDEFHPNQIFKIEFEVIGPGALELYPGPDIQKNFIKPFYVESEIRYLNNKKMAKKKFIYSFLVEKVIKIPQMTFTLSCLNPQRKRYINTFISSDNLHWEKSKPPSSLSKPDIHKLKDRYFTINLINIVLVLMNILLIIIIIVTKSRKRNLLQTFQKNVKRGNINYFEAYDVLKLLDQGQSQNLTLLKKIIKSPISEQSKTYFLQLLKNAEGDFSNKNRAFKEKPYYNRRCFNELGDLIKDKI